MHPFYTDNFCQTWTKYFAKSDVFHEFQFINPVRFVTAGIEGLYVNIGKNITNGLFYHLDCSRNDYENKVFLIYDVLAYPDSEIRLPEGMKIKRIPQYSGYLSDISAFDSYDSFFNHQFSSKTRTNIRKYNKRLESNFDISFHCFCGEMSNEEYERHFSSLLEMIERRFGQLGLDNDIITDQDYYRELCFKMIRDREAALFAIYHEGNPIAISICFLSNKRVYFAITTYDIDFGRYNLGHVLIMKILNWCFENDFNIMDYSKGYYEYKERWATSSYVFENHILYDNRSVKAALIGNVLYFYFTLKQSLRNIGFNKVFSRFKFILNKKQRTSETPIKFLKTIDQNAFDSSLYEEMPKSSEDYQYLRPVIYDTLYSNPQPVEQVKVYKNRQTETYVLQGDKFMLEFQKL